LQFLYRLFNPGHKTNYQTDEKGDFAYAYRLCAYANYLREGFVFIGVFSFVCMLAGFWKNYSTDFHKI